MIPVLSLSIAMDATLSSLMHAAKLIIATSVFMTATHCVSLDKAPI